MPKSQISVILHSAENNEPYQLTIEGTSQGSGAAEVFYGGIAIKEWRPDTLETTFKNGADFPAIYRALKAEMASNEKAIKEATRFSEKYKASCISFYQQKASIVLATLQAIEKNKTSNGFKIWIDSQQQSKQSRPSRPLKCSTTPPERPPRPPSWKIYQEPPPIPKEPSAPPLDDIEQIDLPPSYSVATGQR